MEFDYITIEPSNDGFVVYGHGVYEDSSVLAGQARRSFLDQFDTLAEAKVAWPFAEILGYSTKTYSDEDDLAAISGLPKSPPDWFDPADANESWDDDY